MGAASSFSLTLSRRSLGASAPLRLVVDPDSVRDPCHVVEIRHDLDRIRDRGIIESVCAECVDVGLAHLGRELRELHGEVAERSFARRKVGLPVVMSDVFGELGWGALGTEVVGMRLRSVVAALLGGRDGREQLALLA